MNNPKLIIIIFLVLGSAMALAQTKDQIFQAIGTPAHPRVEVIWNRYYTYDGVTEICKKLAAAHPNLIKLESIGKSYLGKEIWLLTVTNHRNKNHKEKPGFYIDGNIHANELQGTEFSLYTAWYLAESYGSNDFISELMDDKVFYIAPTINPDGRDSYIKNPHTAHSPRSGLVPFDDDRDGLVDEDQFDDLDGNGHITMMRRKTPTGRYKLDPDDPRRLIPAKAHEEGSYELLGWEGIDRDGDGMVNEDREGYYDPNRDWGWNWQPGHVQGGAYKYPFSLSENRAVRDFVMAHPNIAGAQSYHNVGGMLLRGPGAEEDRETYDRNDILVYDAIGKKGEDIIPGYRYLVVYKDLYSVFGGELDWFYGGRGIYTFTNELFASYMYFNDKNATQADAYRFDKDLLFEDAFVPWKEFEHPQFGLIEIGGFKKNFTRNNPGFLLESDAHRNMAFTIFHAYHMPKIEVQSVQERKLDGGLREITATIVNRRMIPTHASHDLKNKIERPDYVILEGAEVQAGLVVENRDMNIVKEQLFEPHKIEVANIPGMGKVVVRWIVSGSKNYSIKVDSAKGGTVTWSSK